jgi:hypothetical protein
MSHTCYCQSVPNSHWWPKLAGLILSVKNHLTLLLEKEYIIIGLENSIKRGYKLKPLSKDPAEIIQINDPVFVSIEQMIEFVKEKDFNFRDFLVLLRNTVKNKLDLDNGLTLERCEVYKRIDTEREYQDFRWNTNLRKDNVPDEEKSVAEWLNYIEFHLTKAKNANYHLDKEASLAELRKVAALAVRAMEIHGCPVRDINASNIGMNASNIGMIVRKNL